MQNRTIDPHKPHATRQDLAEHFSVSLRTIDKWLADRLIPAYKRGTAVRFKIAEVEAHLRTTQKAESSS